MSHFLVLSGVILFLTLLISGVIFLNDSRNELGIKTHSNIIVELKGLLTVVIPHGDDGYGGG